MARACGSYPQCHRFESSRRYHRPVRRGSVSPVTPSANKDGPLVKWLRHGPFTAVTWLERLLHTQEVTGSSPAVSTKKFLISCEIRNFFCLYPQIVTRHFGVFRLTQTVTQKPRGQESTGEGRMASSVPLRLFFVGYMVWLMTLPMVSAAERFIPSVAWV